MIDLSPKFLHAPSFVVAAALPVDRVLVYQMIEAAPASVVAFEGALAALAAAFRVVDQASPTRALLLAIASLLAVQGEERDKN